MLYLVKSFTPITACTTGRREEEPGGSVGGEAWPLRAVHGPAAVLPRHRPGQPVDVQAGEVPGERGQGRLHRLGGGADQEARGL